MFSTAPGRSNVDAATDFRRDADLVVRDDAVLAAVGSALGIARAA